MAAPLVSWRSRFLVALVLASLGGAGVVGAGYWYINAKWRNAHRIELALDAGDANYLVVGSDSRAFVDNPEDAASFGTVGGNRADTIILVRVNAEKRTALLVSFPRDLWVELPDGGSGRINSAFNDGPQALVDTIRQNFEVPVHHYVQVDFAGFRNVVDAMGGVDLYVSAPARDAKTGLDIKAAGCVRLDGDQALAWVRSRHYQSYESGRWRTDPTGDFGRIQRQQDFIRRLIAQGIQAGVSNPFRGDRLADKALANLTVDSRLEVADVLKLVRVFRSDDPDDIEMLTVPGTPTRIAGQSVVALQEDEAAPLFERLRGAGELTVAPSTVTVRVLNGVGTPGLATRTAGDLREAGFLPAGLGDADRYSYTETEIRYRPGAREKAELVRQYLQGVGRAVEDSRLDVDVVVILGADFRGVARPDGEGQAVGPLRLVAARSGPGEGGAQAPPTPTC